MSDTLEYELTEDEGDSEALSRPRYEIFSYPADTTLRGYREQWDAGQLSIPKFQRGFVWDQTRASKLIESFLLGLPVPPVFLYKSSGAKQFEIIDGQQRISSIVFFLKGVFLEKKFRLKGVDSQWAGKSVDELSDSERFTLENAVLRAIVIQQTNPDDNSSVYHVFERLNTGGVRLNAMEVRRCVYEGIALEFVSDLNQIPSWRQIIGLDNFDKRLKDEELVLRVASLYSSFETYEKPMKGFLNQFSATHKDRKNQKITDRLALIKSEFQRACDSIVKELGVRPFHLRGRLNFGALDAVLVAVMRSPKIDNLGQKFQELISDQEFIEDTSFNTSDENVLKRRIMNAIKTLS